MLARVTSFKPFKNSAADTNVSQTSATVPNVSQTSTIDAAEKAETRF
jgi:hypothetical protein